MGLMWKIWKMTFVNQYGVTFTVTEDELGGQSALDYIKYCLDANSILVALEVV